MTLMSNEPRYAPASPRQKAVCGMLLAANAIAWTIDWSGWRAFGGYEHQVVIIVVMITLFYVVRLLAILEQR